VTGVTSVSGSTSWSLPFTINLKGAWLDLLHFGIRLFNYSYNLLFSKQSPLVFLLFEPFHADRQGVLRKLLISKIDFF
jgi:hypothetical protein